MTEGMLRYGLPLIKLGKGAKRPVSGVQYSKVPPLTKDEAKAWVDEGGNLGIRTGEVPGAITNVVILDLDGHEAVYYAGNTLGLRDISTWAAKTSKGYHFYFQHPKDIEIPNSQSKIYPGIDVRGKGGFVVAPGSIHPETGVAYVWVKGMAPWECSLAPCPEWLESLGSKKITSAVLSGGKDNRVEDNEDNPIIRFPGVEEGQRHGEACRLAGILAAQQVGSNAGWKALFHWNMKNRPPMPEKELEKIWDDIQELDKKRHPERYVDQRPVIWLTDELPEIVDNVEEALSKVGHTSKFCVFNRSGILTGVMRDRTGTRIKPLTVPLLQERISVACRLRKPGNKRNFTPQRKHISILMDRGEYHRLPILSWLAYAPCFTADGPIREHGYHPASGVYAAFEASDWPMPDMSKKSHSELVSILLDPFTDFGISGPSISALLCAILTFPALPIIDGPIPLFGISAPIRGAGKTLLARAISIIGTGQEPPMTMPDTSPEETKKALFVTAIEGKPVIVFDNQDPRSFFGTPALAAAITSGVIRDRILGQSRSVEAPWRAVCFVTGNNLRLASDLGRRTMSLFLNPGCSRPEFRSGFKYPNLISVIKRRKHIYLSAAMEVIKRNNGESNVSPVVGGFEEWDRWVRQAVYKATGYDPINSFLGTALKMDMETEQREEFLALLLMRYGPHRKFDVYSVYRLLIEDKKAKMAFCEAFHIQSSEVKSAIQIKRYLDSLDGLYFNGLFFRTTLLKAGSRDCTYIFSRMVKDGDASEIIVE
jgi:hypothetical protein